jgi:hypothetical protein
VIESKDETLPTGTNVVGPLGCKTNAVMSGKRLTKLDFLDGLPISVGIGAAGMPGYDCIIFLSYLRWLNILIHTMPPPPPQSKNRENKTVMLYE